MKAETQARVVRALVPTAAAAALLLQEFAVADLATDGTLFTVVIYGVGYTDVIARLRAWMNASQIGPVLVTDDEMGELLLSGFAPRSRRAGLPAAAPENGESAIPADVAVRPDE